MRIFDEEVSPEDCKNILNDYQCLQCRKADDIPKPEDLAESDRRDWIKTESKRKGKSWEHPPGKIKGK